MSLRQAIERYGLAVGVVLVLIVTLVALPGNAPRTTGLQSSAGPNGGTAGPGGQAGDGSPGSGAAGVDGAGTSATGAGASASGGGATATGAGGVTAPGAASAGGGTAAAGRPGAPAGGAGGVAAGAAKAAFRFGSGPHCRPDGRQIGIYYASPPCVEWTGAPDNGGSTGRGVTKDKVVVVRYLAQIDPGTRAILQSAGLSDDTATVRRAYEALFRYGNLHNETYGRQVVLVDFPASGPTTSDEASRADAIKIAGDIKPFAVIEGDPAGPAPITFIKELARRNVLCFCSTSLPSGTYTSLPPVVFSALPTIDEYASQVAEYVCKHTPKGSPAKFAGPGVQNQPRKFGLIYLAGMNGVVVPEQAATKGIAEAAFARCGITFDKEVQYLYDPGRNQNDVTNLISQMKAAGVTTIVPFWDPLYPILITKEATNQAYFPEWIMTGTGLSDTTTAGRLYDQAQWQHAFGVSPLWVTWATVARSGGAREYHWARPDDAAGQEGVLINVYRSRISELFSTIHMAGPNLTSESASAGALSVPKAGGAPAKPLVYRTRQFPNAIKDFVEVWYDYMQQGPDERGQSGPGMVVKADNGKRFLSGQWYTGDPKAFVKAGGLTVSDSPPGGGDETSDTDPRAYPPGKACLSCP